MDNNQGNTNQDEKQKKKHRKDPFSGLTGGLILIVLGTLFFLASSDIISWDNWWAYFLIGLGGVFLLETLLRLANPDHGPPQTGKVIGGVVLIIIGASSLYGMVTWWPLILIAVGLFIIISSFSRAKKE